MALPPIVARTRRRRRRRAGLRTTIIARPSPRPSDDVLAAVANALTLVGSGRRRARMRRDLSDHRLSIPRRSSPSAAAPQLDPSALHRAVASSRAPARGPAVERRAVADALDLQPLLEAVGHSLTMFAIRLRVSRAGRGARRGGRAADGDAPFSCLTFIRVESLLHSPFGPLTATRPGRSRPSRPRGLGSAFFRSAHRSTIRRRLPRRRRPSASPRGRSSRRRGADDRGAGAAVTRGTSVGRRSGAAPAAIRSGRRSPAAVLGVPSRIPIASPTAAGSRA